MSDDRLPALLLSALLVVSATAAPPASATTPDGTDAAKDGDEAYAGIGATGGSTGAVDVTSSGSLNHRADRYEMIVNENQRLFTANNDGPDILYFNVESYSSAETILKIEFHSDEQLTDLQVHLTDDDGNLVAAFEKSDLAENDRSSYYEYETTYQVESDGGYRAELTSASGESGDDPSGATSDATTVDTTPPTITDFELTNDGSDVGLSFDASEPLVDLTVAFEGDAPADPYHASDFSRTENDDGTFTYAADVSDNREEGRAEATLTEAVDDHGHDGADDRTASHEWDVLAPTISDFSVTNPEDRSVNVTVDASEPLADVVVTLDGPESGRLTADDFAETDGGYAAMYAADTDGEYAASLETATDGHANDGAGDEADSVVVDTRAPNVSTASAIDADENGLVSDGERVSVVVDASDAGSEVERVTADASPLGSGTVTLTDDGDGRYEGTLVVDGSASPDGEYGVDVTVADAAGNERTSRTERLELDTAAPTVDDPPSLDRTDDISPGRPIEVVVTASDDNGVADVEVSDVQLERADGDWIGSVPAASELGEHAFEAVVRDEAGNERVVETAEYRVGRETALPETDDGTFSTAVDDPNVDEVSIETDESRTDAAANLWVDTGTTNPLAADPEGTALYFPRIDPSISNENITDATVTAAVWKSRIRQQYVAPDTISFWVEARDGPGWERIDAELVAESDAAYTYEIAVPHFSAFAVTGETESAAPSVGEFGPASDSPTSGEVTLEASLKDDYSGVDPTNVTLTLGGEDVTGDATVTPSGLTYVANLSAGEYGAALSVADNASNVRSASTSFSVSDGSAAGDGGGGAQRGGGSNPSPPPVQVSLTDATEDGFTARIVSARAGSLARAEPDGGVRGGDVTFRGLAVTPESDDPLARFLLDARAAADAPEDASALEAEPLGFLRVEPTYVAGDDLAEVSVAFAVPAETIDAPENVVAYSLGGDEWHRIETTLVAEGDGEYVLEAAISGAGAVGVGVLRSDLGVTEATVSPLRVEPDDPVEVTATVENAGAGEGTRTVGLEADGDVVATRTIAVASGESKTVSFEVAFDEPGERTLSVAGVGSSPIPVGSVAVESETAAATPDETTVSEETVDLPAETAESDTGGDGETPGFEGSTAIYALLAALFAARERLRP